MKTALLLFMIFFAISMNSHAQDLSSHQWEDRLVLILTEDTSNTTYQKQLDELYSDEPGLKDRKLVVYTILPKKFKREDKPDEDWISSSDLYSKYKDGDSPFEIVLIGLDSGVKLRQEEFLSNEELFARIDRMPMRRGELKNQAE